MIEDIPKQMKDLQPESQLQAELKYIKVEQRQPGKQQGENNKRTGHHAYITWRLSNLFSIGRTIMN